jgi:hypothetical protein
MRERFPVNDAFIYIATIAVGCVCIAIVLPRATKRVERMLRYLLVNQVRREIATAFHVPVARVSETTELSRDLGASMLDFIHVARRVETVWAVKLDVSLVFVPQMTVGRLTDLVFQATRR